MSRRPLQGRLRGALQRNAALAARAERPGRAPPALQREERPGQAGLLQLARWLAALADPRGAALLVWPLHDKALERTFKAQLLGWLAAHYSPDGSLRDDRWLTPVRASYLVDASGFKVALLLFEMSQLALRKVLLRTLDPHDERLQVTDLARYVNSQDELNENVRIVKERLRTKTAYLQRYREMAVSIVEKYKDLLEELQEEYKSKKELLDRCVNEFPLKSRCESELENLKIVNYSAFFLQYWWDLSEDILTDAENAWTERNRHFVDLTKSCRKVSEATVLRNTLKDNSSYTIEYCPENDKVNTEKLETQVSSQQRYILKNIVKDNKLNFPNLLRSYTVAICFYFKNVRCVEPMGEFNHHLGVVSANYDDLLKKGKVLLDDMHILELKLQEQEKTFEPALMDDDYDSIEMVIPPLPDLRFRDEPWQNPIFDKCFTPLNMCKIQFNIRNFVPTEFKQPRSLFQVPTHNMSRTAFSKNMAKLHADDLHTTVAMNISKISLPAKDKLNETTDCSNGFTKQQINRLLSCRKTSSSKKMKSAKKSSHGKLKRSCLFTETPESSFALFRSHSSPNLCPPSELKKKLAHNYLAKNLYAIAQEDSPDKLLEISGITQLRTSKNCTPQKNSPLNTDFTSMPLISITKPEFKLGTTPSLSSGLDSMVDILINQPSKIIAESKTSAINAKTPQNAANSEKKKSNSIDRLIERYKRISQNTRKLNIDDRSPVLSPITDDRIEEKENINQINVNTSFSPRLPDLLSPSCNILPKASPIVPESDLLDLGMPEPKGKFKCRESLGTALGVDISFLDQNDLVIPE